MLMSYFADVPRGSVRLGAAGKIVSGADAARVLAAGMDFVVIGRSAVLHHDFARRVAADPAFVPVPTPVDPEYLRSEGLSDPFIGHAALERVRDRSGRRARIGLNSIVADLLHRVDVFRGGGRIDGSQLALDGGRDRTGISGSPDNQILGERGSLPQ